ncbi:putative MFS family arabinose efflux permease [Kibdelosporangium banguiense]|uniref:MFS family arabinose efflux permease n=1 Tax=Kibdelosporangium banguiense TaxID=1365924 RepID=A0ABS4TPM1_9PSEU|nr:MFS transporter [Kibdelosporangium banguiense]MBP2326350.1 putative MFS family arabinose efflux permease [Kibdelosporangium banguiense]
MATPISRDSRVPVLGLVLLATPTSLSANTTTTVIPGLARDLGISAAEATWAATAFGWGTVVGAVLTATLLRIRSERSAVLVNAVLVLFGTVLVVLAPQLGVLLGGRAAQAMGGSGLIIVAISVAGTTRRTGAITAGVGLVGAFGPLAGAALSGVSWRLPLSLSLIALLAVPVILSRVSADRGSGAQHVDVIGIGLVAGLVSALVFIPRFPVPALVAAAVAVVLLGLHIRRHPDGFVPRAVLRSRVFLVLTVTICALSTSYFVSLYLVPRLLESEWSASRIGTTILITLAAGSVASLLFTRYTTHLSPSVVRTVITGAGLLAPVLLLSTSSPSVDAAATALAVFAGTAGLAWYATKVGKEVPDMHRVTAVNLFTLSYQLGGAFGPALVTIMM